MDVTEVALFNSGNRHIFRTRATKLKREKNKFNKKRM